jgi:NIMA (never in mitosis gene a)-related kinase
VDLSFYDDITEEFQDDSASLHTSEDSLDTNITTSTSSIILIDNRYVVKNIIGRGAFGVVNLVVDVKNPKCQYALKQVLCADDNDINRAIKEPWLLHTLQHEALVPVESIFVHFGQNSISNMREHYVCFVMPFYELGDLEKFLKKRAQKKEPLTQSELINYMVQLASGVACLHEHNLLHRDLKPSNILLSNEYQSLHICDFGLMKTLENTTQCKTVAGTVKYMAPEVLGGTNYSYPADIWSMGCIFYELCHLELEKNMYMEVFVNPNYLRQIRESIIGRAYSIAVADLICSMLARDMKDRPTINQVVEKLSQIKSISASTQISQYQPRESLEERIAKAVDEYILSQPYDKSEAIDTTIDIPSVRALLEEYSGNNPLLFIINALMQHSKAVEFNKARTHIRKSKLNEKLCAIVSKYFSDKKYYRDKFLLSIASHDEDGYIPISVVMSLSGISNIMSRYPNVSAERVGEILKSCQEVEISNDLLMVRKCNMNDSMLGCELERKIAGKIDKFFLSNHFDRETSQGHKHISMEMLLQIPRIMNLIRKRDLDPDKIIPIVEKYCNNVLVERSSDNHIYLIRRESSQFRRTVTLPYDDFEFGMRVPNQLTIMSFNILAQCHKHILEGYLDRHAGKWKRRFRYIISQIELYKPNIICLQDMQTSVAIQRPRRGFFGAWGASGSDDHFGEINRYLARMGYQSYFKQNTIIGEETSDIQTGVAIFIFQRDFEVIGILNIETGPEIYSMCKESQNQLFNVGQVAQIVHIRRGDRHILVCNTQLCSGDDMEHVRMLQIYIIMKGIKKYHDSCPQNTAIILSGDFQSVTNSPVYDYIHDGKLSDRTQQLITQSAHRHNFVMPNIDLQSGLELKSCYDTVLGREPITCCTADTATTIDYIFCNRALWPNAALQEPSIELLRNDARRPKSKTFASHHIPLLVKFEFQ